MDAILEGSLRVAGGRMRVGAKLVDVGEDHRHQCRRLPAPARAGDVDLADAAHAVRVEEGVERATGGLATVLVLAALAAAFVPRRSFDVFALSAVALGLNTLAVAGLGRLLFENAHGDPIGRLFLLGTEGFEKHEGAILEVARRAGIAHTTYLEYEGGGFPDVVKGGRIASVFGTSSPTTMVK